MNSSRVRVQNNCRALEFKIVLEPWVRSVGVRELKIALESRDDNLYHAIVNNVMPHLTSSYFKFGTTSSTNTGVSSICTCTVRAQIHILSRHLYSLLDSHTKNAIDVDNSTPCNTQAGLWGREGDSEMHWHLTVFIRLFVWLYFCLYFGKLVRTKTKAKIKTAKWGT